MSVCGCVCVCHEDEHEAWWPGPCAGCCEPGDDCACGRALDRHAEERERQRRERKVLDNRRSVFLLERLSREPSRRRGVRRGKRGAS